MIVFDHVTVPGRLSDITFSIPQGARLGIVGRSGAGKSSLIALLTGQLTPQSGTVTMSTGISSATVGYIPQDPGSTLLPHRPVAESVVEPQIIAGKKSKSAEIQQRLPELFQELGLAAELKDRTPEQLSGGQCQRVAIARALLGNPQLIIADEAFSALDKDNAALLQDVLMRTEATVISISHDINALTRVCTHMLVLSTGKIAFFGSPDELLSHSGDDDAAWLVAAARELGESS